MPVILREHGYRFEFYSSDADERPHVHVKKNGKHAKFWLWPAVTLVFARRFKAHEVNKILKLLEQHRDEFLERWHGFFGDRA